MLPNYRFVWGVTVRWLGFVVLRILLNVFLDLLTSSRTMAEPSTSSLPPSDPPHSEGTRSGRLRRISTAVFSHVKQHAGVGVVCAVAYFDPLSRILWAFFFAVYWMACFWHSGNWGVDLQAGSLYGYRLLFVVLLAGLFAVFLQVRYFELLR